MSLWDDGEEVFTMGSLIIDGEYPCGCSVKCPRGYSVGVINWIEQLTHYVKDCGTVAECPKCGATWDDDAGWGE